MAQGMGWACRICHCGNHRRRNRQGNHDQHCGRLWASTTTRLGPTGLTFGPMWAVLYASMAVSAWLVWRSHPARENRVPLAVYGVQLVLNLAWTPLFFGLGWRGTAFIEIFVLWAFIAATVALFWHRSRWAAILLLPYLTWTTFAVVLNFSVWQLNN